MDKIVYINKTIKSKTNNNELCKQYFTIYGTNENDIALLINKFVLSTDFNSYKDYRLVRTYKNYGFFHTYYGIKMDTLNKVNIWIAELLNK